MSLDAFITFEEDKKFENNTVLLIDGHNMAYRNAYSSIFQDPLDNGPFDLWRHQMLQSIFYTIRKFNPSKVVFAFDEKNSWRYKLYPEYKANRKAKKEKSSKTLDHDAFIKVFEQFINDIKILFTNTYVIKLDRTEGDDIIAVLAKETFKNDNVIIISCDSDLHQLMTRNIKQFDPIKNKFIECINLKKELELKIISGDRSDNISAIKKGVGIKTAEKILNMGVDTYIKEFDENEQTTIKEKYELNHKLINLSFIPQDIKKSIVDEYNNYQISPINGKEIVRYFMKNKLTKQFTEWTKNSELFKQLK
jgi:5'-3' exonuclease